MSEKAVALSVASIAGFQLLQAWNTNAPSLAECRQAPPGDRAISQQLVDADVLVGGTAVILGTAIAIMTHDKTALTVMLALFGSVSLWHHTVLKGVNDDGTSWGMA